MKKILTLVQLLALSHLTFADAITDYYHPETLVNLSGYELKSELKRIIKASHQPQSYSALFQVYFESDIDETYDNDGSILDIYSERVNGPDHIVYEKRSHMCGNYRREGDCFNREHLFPQGVFDKKYPMRSDFFHIVPTDGYVNNRRGSFPFGEVNTPDWISGNGSKVGPNTTPGYRGTVFEPIDEFKGDVARAMLYFAIRYEDRIPHWHHAMLDGSSTQVYTDWQLAILIKWHNQDPVSAHEVKRNKHGQRFQGNRNPLIDFPEFVEKIWL